MPEQMREGITLVPVVAPKSLGGRDAEPFVAMTHMENLMCAHDAGHDYFHSDAAEILPGWHDQTDTTRLGFVAYRGLEVVGAVNIMIANEAGSRTVEFDLCTHPDHWGEGVEELLLHTVENVARERRRPIVQAWTLHRSDSVDQILPSPTGFGGIPAHDRHTVFFQQHGYSLEQAERNSVFDMSTDFERVDAMLTDALRVAGPDYRVLSWTAPTPAEHADGFAFVLSRMSTDAPSGAMVFDEERWDRDRVARRDARLAAGGHTVSVAAVQHIPTRTIVAYNELAIGGDHTRGTHQYGTLVVTEHRGRRLGTIVKCVNLQRWRRLVPESPRVSTFNAEENRHMLDINEAIGFVPASHAGAWKKVLT